VLDDVVVLEAHWDRVACATPGEVSVELRTPGGPVASRRAGMRHYAASTVKLAVAVATLAEVTAGRLDLSHELEITDTFPSAAGGWFTMHQLDDQDDATWHRRGGRLPVGTLLERMIVDSSNLATNTILQELTFGPVREMVTAACGAEITVHRLIGDARAEAGGLTNTVTARGLGLLLCALVTGTLLPAEATHHALELLTRQKHRRMIPAGLPPGTWSASKGGWTAAVRHDVALVRPDDAPAYVLAVCTTTGLDDAADGLVARLSTVTWEHWSQWHAS
jgi:beta-lactamase class A